MATQNKKLLIIDDDQEIQNLLTVYLRKDYSLEHSLSGDEALALLEKSSELPDLIILDLEMPGTDGAAFRKKLKSIERLKHIPIMYLSANNLMIDKLEHDFEFDFVNKPIEKEDLLSLLESFFNLKK